MLHGKKRWWALAAVFFVLGFPVALPFWILSKLGRLAFKLANLFLAPFVLCRDVARGGRGPYEPRVNRRANPKWRVVRGDSARGEVVSAQRGRK
jgi:hypothetical protein